MLQNLDYMILLDTDISFCMVCKLWYISIRCIFKNLVLKLRIYNFRGVCVCNCPPHLPSPYTKHLPFIPSIILPLPLFKRCSECLRLCLLSAFRFYSYSCWSPSISIFILYILPFFFTGVIYLLFLKMGLWCCNAPCTTHFWELY